jgi:hypothetical protein
MAASTGPVILAGALELANQTVLKPGGSLTSIPWRLLPATAGLALGLALLEKAAPGFAVGLAWLLVAGVFVFPVAGGKPLLDNVNTVLKL